MKFLFLLFYHFKFIFTYTTQRTHPIFGQRLKWYSRLYALFRISDFGVIDPLTNCTNIFFHKSVILWFNIQARLFVPLPAAKINK